MGYDMRFVTTPAGEAERVTAAREMFYAACRIRDSIPREEHGRFTREEITANGLDGAPSNASARFKSAQATVTAAYDLLSSEEGSYFRLNIGGMSRYARLMFQFGMLYGGEYRAEWPAWNAYPDNAELQEKFEAAHPLRQGVPRAGVRQGPGRARRRGGQRVPAHKFGTNDGWIVTPEEIKAALAAYESVVPTRREAVLAEHLPTAGARSYWDRWIEYLRGAADHGGFEVY